MLRKGTMDTELAERLTTSTEEWTCACGRANAAGLSLCPHCGRVPPRGIKTVSLAIPGRLEYKPRVRGVRLAFGVILLNILTQGFVLGLVQAGRMESSKAIALSMWMGLAFYGVVLGMLAGPMLSLRPKWVKGDPQTAWLLGAEVGLAFAGVLIALLWAATGHPVLDPGAQALVSEGSITRIVLAFLVIAVAAPVVEELLFRGVVTPSDWQVADGPGVPDNAQLVLKGPSGATLLVQRLPLPGQRNVNLEAVAAALNSGRVPLPPDNTIDGRAHVATYPAGQGVEVGVTGQGHAGVVVLIPRGAQVWRSTSAPPGATGPLMSIPASCSPSSFRAEARDARLS